MCSDVTSEADVILHSEGLNRVEVSSSRVFAPENFTETTVLAVDHDKIPSDAFPILRKGEVFKPLVASLGIEIRPPSNSTTKQVRNVQTPGPYSGLTSRLAHKTIRRFGVRRASCILELAHARDNWLFSPSIKDGGASIFY